MAAALTYAPRPQRGHTLRLSRHLWLLLFLWGPGFALSLPDIISDRMVIPREKPVTIWGWAQPGEKIEVFFLLQRAVSIAGPDGRFEARYPKGFGLTGGPFLLVIQGAGKPVVIHEVMVGDLWFAMGGAVQGERLGQVLHGPTEISNAHHMRLRFFLPQRQTGSKDSTNLKGVWVEAHPTNAATLPALGYLTARDIWKKTYMPQGVVDLNYPASPAEAWVGELSFRTNDRFDRLFTRTKYYLPMETNEPLWRERSRELRDLQKLWEMNVAEWVKPETNQAHILARSGPKSKGPWSNQMIPGPWKDRGIRAEGVVWYRRWVVLPPTFSNQGASLQLGRLGTYDMCFWNGAAVGSNWGPGVTAYTPRRYDLSSNLIKAGSNLLAVRIYDVVPFTKGGFLSPPSEIKIVMPGEKSLPLAGTWQMGFETVVDPLKYPPRPELGRPFQVCSSLYHGMLAPLRNLSPSGVWWEGGEANGSRAAQYRDLFPCVVRDTRQLVQNPNLPFYHLQSPGLKTPRRDPGESELAELREGQARVVQIKKNTGLVPTIDLWAGSNQNHMGVFAKDVAARRLAQWVLVNHFKIKGDPVPPAYKSMKVEAEKVRLDFTGVGAGLVWKNPPDLATNGLCGFAICAADRRFYWATAKLLDKNTVEVSAPQVGKPVAVRYGWADRPWVNLYNQAGLPVVPFRTDDFPLTTEGVE